MKPFGLVLRNAIAKVGEIGERIVNPGKAFEKAALIRKAREVETFSAAVRGSTLPTDLQMALILRGEQGQSAPEAIDYAANMHSICFAATRLNACGDATAVQLAADAVTNNTSAAQLRTQLIDAKADAEEEIVTTLPRPSVSGGNPLNPQKIWEQRRAESSKARNAQR